MVIVLGIAALLAAVSLAGLLAVTAVAHGIDSWRSTRPAKWVHNPDLGDWEAFPR
jgi:hypothetical protein